MQETSPRDALKILAAGACAMILAMGIGRFSYTPILPRMQSALPFPDDLAGYLASANYLGYLLGALAASFLPGRRRVFWLRIGLAASVATTAAMGLTTRTDLWLGLRFVSGLASAGVFVLTSGMVLEALARGGRPAWAGHLYGSIGAGIALTGLAVPPLGALFGWRGSWLGLAAIGLPAAVWSWRRLADEGAGQGEAAGGREKPKEGRRFLPWLWTAYFLEGLGYVVTATFLVVILQRTPGTAGHGAAAWVVTGLAAVPSCFLWVRLAGRIGYPAALILAHLVQAVGILLPALLPGTLGAYLGALGFGGTMLGIVTLTLALGRLTAPGNPGRVIGLLTAGFGLGQIIGPAAAGVLAARTGDFTPALAAASAVVAAGALCVAVGRKRAGVIPPASSRR